MRNSPRANIRCQSRGRLSALNQRVAGGFGGGFGKEPASDRVSPHAYRSTSSTSYAILLVAVESLRGKHSRYPVYPDLVKKRIPPELDFHERLVSLRKERGLTQQALAALVEMHISQIRRYESGQSQPTLDAIRKLARALSVSADMLLFAQDERGPDDDLKLQFEAASRLNPDEKNVIRSVIESIVLRNTVKAAERRFTATDSGATTR